MTEEERNYCSDTLHRFSDVLDVESLSKISAMTSAPAIAFGYLYQRPEGASVSELVSHVGCRPSRITAIINAGEKKGTLERFHKHGDHRRVFVRLTKSGKKEVETYRNRLLLVASLLCEHFGKEKIESFIKDVDDAITFLRSKEVCKC